MLTKGLVEKFRGENFLAFSDRLKGLMILENDLYEQLFKGAESSDQEINDADFPNAEKLGLSKILTRILLLHCDSTIDPILQAHTTDHGL